MFRPKLAVWLSIAFVAAWLASCSADVDGYRLATSESSAMSSGAGAGTGGESGSGGRTLTGSGGAGGDSDGSAGKGGGHQPPREAGVDGDSSLASGGGAPAGGAGGAQSGGAGGTGGGVTGGNQNGGAGGGVTGGVPNTGGATGGIPNTGGVTGGTAGTGGAPTGGRPNTGGNPTGGAPTGGSPTGGAPTGGAPTGGAPTGGAPTGGIPNTGGSPTGGTAGTGGAGGYPGDPLQTSFSGPTLTGITAASWVPGAQKFYLLKPSTHEYFVLSTDGSVTGGVPLQGSGNVAANVFGATTTDVMFVRGSPAAFFRQPISGGSATQVTLVGAPALGTLCGAYANGWLLIGNSSGAYQAFQDGSSSITTSANLDQIHGVATDTTRFVFRNQGPSLSASLHDIAPGNFSVNSSPCNTGTFNSSIDLPNGVFGSTVAWVFSRPFAAPLELNIGSVDGTGKCTSALQATFGTNMGTSAGSSVVGLINATDALVNTTNVGSMATIEFRRAGDPAFTRAPVTVAMGTSITPRTLVVGVEATTHHAVLVTNDVPALISF